MLTQQSTRQRVDNEFIVLVKKLHPEKSFREATKELNWVLQEIIYGKEKKDDKE